MEKLQYDSFYKFIVSLGALLIAAPVVLVCYLFSYSSDLLISEQSYTDLSKFSLDMLNYRHIVMKSVFGFLPYVAIALFIFGVFFIVVGSIKWFQIQKTLDENVDLDVKSKRFNFEKMTAAEIAEKSVNEVLEIQSEHDSIVSAASQISEKPENESIEIQKEQSIINPTAPEVSETQVDYKSTIQIDESKLSQINRNISETISVENACFQYLRRKFRGKYILRQGIKVGLYEYDIIALSRHNNPDLLYEIKYLNHIVPATYINRILERLTSSRLNYTNSTNKNCTAHLVVVIKQDRLLQMKEHISRLVMTFESKFEDICIEYISYEELFESTNTDFSSDKYSSCSSS